MTSGQSGSPRILLFGDSIAEGLGVRDGRYGEVLAKAVGADLCDFSRTGTTVRDSLMEYRARPQSGEVALIAHGVTEAIIRPTPQSLVYMPRRWQRRGWMDPRPYYSRRWHRRILERAESGLRWRVKNLVLKNPRWSCQVLPIDEYIEDLLALASETQRRGAHVIIVGAPAIDERFFPGSQVEQRRYAEAVRAAGLEYVGVEDQLHRWSDYFDDRFHPNEKGHRRIAEILAGPVMAALRGSGRPSGFPTSAEENAP